MTKELDSLIEVHGRFARSANIERDAATLEPFDGYLLTARALDVVDRIATTAAKGSGGAAWSLTGPYGSGKSSLALFIDALFGPSNEAVHARAMTLLGEADPRVFEKVQTVRGQLTGARGFLRGFVTAQRDPVAHTVLQALHAAALDRFGRMPTQRQFEHARTLRDALNDAESRDPRRTGPSPAALVDIARALAHLGPLLIVIDEFGKNLEAAAEDSRSSDPYLLQQLAELGQGARGLPIFMLTMQHLAFGDYLAGSDAQRQEWAKVQGRFEDIVYLESPSQIRTLIASVFTPSTQLAKPIAKWAREQAAICAELGLRDLADPALLGACYPLHPLTVAVLPELCARYGQNERTLFSFLAGADPLAVPARLKEIPWDPKGPAPTIGLDAVYDYFVDAGTAMVSLGHQASRWIEIGTRLQDLPDLEDDDRDLIKAVGVLNLVSSGGALRASDAVLSYATPTHGLSRLQDAGILTWREFSDEHRIWQGSDIDLRATVEVARTRLEREPLSSLLSRSRPLTPVVAARHSAQFGVLRIFERRYVDETSRVRPPEAFDPIDGLLLYVLSVDGSLPALEGCEESSKPVVSAVPDDLTALRTAALEAAALAEALSDNEAVEEDWVARRELTERLILAQQHLDQELDAAFGTQGACRYAVFTAQGSKVLAPGRGTAALSTVADDAYIDAPAVRNEMLNRTEPTSQGAKARRLLLEAMIGNSSEEKLGLDGYGPEMAMYLALLHNTGMHHLDPKTRAWALRAPKNDLNAPWTAIENEFKRARQRRVNLNDLYATLLSPPIGMKLGPIPVLVTAALLVARDEVAIYEHGTFRPALTPEISERMVRNPAHFELKHYATGSGARRTVVETLAAELSVSPAHRKQRVTQVLSIVGHLVTRVNALPEYTRRTRYLPDKAVAVRDALLNAVEPDELIFAVIPQALGHDQVPPTRGLYAQASELARDLAEAMSILEAAYPQLLSQLTRAVLDATSERARKAVEGQAASLDGEVLDPELRGFLNALAADTLEDDEWIEYVAMVIAGKAPSFWTDADRTRFDRAIFERGGAFRRLLALHSERRARDGIGFDAVRLTMTRGDGTEDARLVSIADDDHDRVSEKVTALLADLGAQMDSREQARQAVLAVLAEEMLTESSGLPEIRAAETTQDLVHEGQVKHG